eukprot:3614193-Pleurochrysis_carterae.AAC.3
MHAWFVLRSGGVFEVRRRRRVHVSIAACSAYCVGADAGSRSGQRCVISRRCRIARLLVRDSFCWPLDARANGRCGAAQKA